MIGNSVSKRCYYVSLTWQFLSFTRAYNSTPTVLVSANHSTTVSGNSAPIHNGITTWIEVTFFLIGTCRRDVSWQTNFKPKLDER